MSFVFTFFTFAAAVVTFAGSSVTDGSGHVSVKALFAVVAVAAGGVVTTVHAHASALPPRKLVQLHVESTAAGVKVAVACYGNTEHKNVSVPCTTSKYEAHVLYLI